MDASNEADKKAIILIVDDVPENLRLLNQILTDAGYRVLLTKKGSEALAIAKNAEPDLILLDIMMPGIDGFEVCKRLKEDSATAEIPVIFLTALSESDDIVRGFQLGAVDYVTKPFNTVEVLARVRTHLRLREEEQKREKLIGELQEALAKVKVLSGLLPICSVCKKVRDDEGYWQQVESYISDHSEAKFSHSFCPECLKEWYGNLKLTRDDKI